jgi:hypothetical protein
VAHLERRDRVVVAAKLVVRPELDQADRVRVLADQRLQDLEQRLEAWRAVHGQGHLASAKAERLDHAGQTEQVVCVEVRQEDLLQVDQPDRLEELALRPLAAVEEQAVAAAADQRGGQRAAGGRGRARGAEEEHVQVHRF